MRLGTIKEPLKEPLCFAGLSGNSVSGNSASGDSVSGDLLSGHLLSGDLIADARERN